MLLASKGKGKNQLISIIKKGSWDIPAVFAELERRGADPSRMYNTFNMGIGFILAVKAADADAIIAEFEKFAANDKIGSCKDMKAYKIGRVARASGSVNGQADAVLFE